jgi:hypothetical protein
MEGKDLETLKRHKKIYSKVALASFPGMLTAAVTPAGLMFVSLLGYCQWKGSIYNKYIRKKKGVYPLEFEH